MIYPQKNASEPQDFGVRVVGRVNILGLQTLIRREIMRFMRVVMQTIFAPVLTAVMFLAVFSLALGADRPNVLGVNFMVFLAPGLLMMTMLQNAFANSSSSLLQAKMMGTIVDLLMPPIGPGELLFAMMVGAIARAMIICLLGIAIIVPFEQLPVSAPWAILAFGLLGSSLMAFLGVLAGLWADKFDHLAAVTNFVITPLTFLSGTFYLIERLPDGLNLAAQLNPFFYLIDGFRYGFLGEADSNLAVGVGVLIASNLILAWATFVIMKRGWRIKS